MLMLQALEQYLLQLKLLILKLSAGLGFVFQTDSKSDPCGEKRQDLEQSEGQGMLWYEISVIWLKKMSNLVFM